MSYFDFLNKIVIHKCIDSMYIHNNIFIECNSYTYKHISGDFRYKSYVITDDKRIILYSSKEIIFENITLDIPFYIEYHDNVIFKNCAIKKEIYNSRAKMIMPKYKFINCVAI